MKLFFYKNSNNEIELKLQRGTIVEDFSYTEMVRQLLDNNKFEDTDFGELTAEEQQKINSMLDKIHAVFEEEKEVENK